MFTAFTSRRKHEQVTARLIVRRVKRLNPHPRHGRIRGRRPGRAVHDLRQWRYHAIFTDSPEAMLAAEATHRAHAVVEQVIADLKAGPLAHLPSGVFTANAAWLALAVDRVQPAARRRRPGRTPPGHGLAVATTATLRARLITVPARIARSARRLTLHLPTRWPWREHWTRLADHTLRPLSTAPPTAA